jgi:voltage-gated potassium channel
MNGEAKNEMNALAKTDDSLVQRARDLYDKISRPMMVLSFVWLAVFSTVLPHQGEQNEERFSFFLVRVALIIMNALWTLYLADFVLYLVALRGEEGIWKKALHGLGVFLLPMFRISIPTFSHPDKIWIPFMGWRKKKRALERRLVDAFSLPMICIVLLILPILGIEYLKKEWIQYRAVEVTLSIGSQLIWLAFAVEFVIMISVTRKKLAYCAKRWIDLAIIMLPILLFLLPYLSFLPIVRLTRLSRVLRSAQVLRSTRLLRLKGLGLKAFQALVLVSGTRRFGKKYHERMLKRLKKRLKEMEEEMVELKIEIAELEKLKARDEN